MDFGHKICQIAQERDRKGRSKKASFTFGHGPRPKHVNRIPRQKVGVSLVVQANVKVTAKRLDYYVERANRERSFGSNRWVKVGRRQLCSNQSPSWTQQRFLAATKRSRARDRNLTQNFGYEHANAPIILSAENHESGFYVCLGLIWLKKIHGWETIAHRNNWKHPTNDIVSIGT